MRGWSRSEFAERLGVSQPIVSKWLSRHALGQGRHMPADERLRRIAEVFGSPIEEVRWRAAHPNQPFPGTEREHGVAGTERSDALVRLVCLAAATYSAAHRDDVLDVAARYENWVTGRSGH